MTTYTAVEMVALCDATFRNVDLWCHRGLFGDKNRRPRGRQFTSDDVVVGAVLMRVAGMVHQIPRDMMNAIAAAVRGDRARWLTVHPNQCAFCVDDLVAVDWAAGAVLVVDVDAVRTETERRMADA